MNKALVIAAHPDDEALGLGGTWFKLKSSGWQVGVLWLTNGISSRGEGSESHQIRIQHTKQHCHY